MTNSEFLNYMPYMRKENPFLVGSCHDTEIFTLAYIAGALARQEMIELYTVPVKASGKDNEEIYSASVLLHPNDINRCQALIVECAENRHLEGFVTSTRGAYEYRYLFRPLYGRALYDRTQGNLILPGLEMDLAKLGKIFPQGNQLLIDTILDLLSDAGVQSGPNFRTNTLAFSEWVDTNHPHHRALPLIDRHNSAIPGNEFYFEF